MFASIGTLPVATPDNGTAAFLTVGQVAVQFKVPAWKITYLFDRGRLDCEQCPVVSGRRLIPADYLPAVRRELRRMKSVR